jgi:hypothetical protein
MPDDFYTHRPGLGNVGSFQVAGFPYITGSTLATGSVEQRIVFPYVAKHINVQLLSAGDAKIYFVSASSPGNVIGGRHFWTLSGSSASFEQDVKCKELYISSVAGATYQVYAEMTSISTQMMFALTGSGLTS